MAANDEYQEPSVQDPVDAIALYTREALECKLAEVAAFLRDILGGLYAHDDTKSDSIAAELDADERNWEFEYKGSATSSRCFSPV